MTSNRHHHPLDRPAHHHKSLASLEAAVADYYGVKDVAAWYAYRRKQLLDTCANDEYRITDHETLADLWEASCLVEKYIGETKKERQVREREEALMSKATVPQLTATRVYRAQGTSASSALVTTDAQSLDAFVSDLIVVLVQAHLENFKDFEQDCRAILLNAVPICFKLAGYKADRVVERRSLACGAADPAQAPDYASGLSGVSAPADATVIARNGPEVH